ncbi:MAG: cytochrome oxidase putative small subunit CydP [Steroidobacteraceae bacterium]|jgi:hypothetical protein
MSFRALYLWRAHDVARPARDVLAALAVKGILLFAIYLLFFSPAHEPRSDASATAHALIGSSASKETP